MTAPVEMRDVVIVGGRCYGSFYAGQLARAKEKGKASFRRVMIVDRNADCKARKEFETAPDRTFVMSDWSGFFDDYLGSVQPTGDGQPGDYIVPSPHMPHLMFEWMLRRARARWRKAGRDGRAGAGSSIRRTTGPDPTGPGTSRTRTGSARRTAWSP